MIMIARERYNLTKAIYIYRERERKRERKAREVERGSERGRESATERVGRGPI